MADAILPFQSDVPIKNSVPIRPWTKLVQRNIPMLQEEERTPVSVVDYGNLERNGISREIMMSVDPLDIATAMSMEVPAPLKVGKITNPENVLRREGKFVVIQNNSGLDSLTNFTLGVRRKRRLPLSPKRRCQATGNS